MTHGHGHGHGHGQLAQQLLGERRAHRPASSITVDDSFCPEACTAEAEQAYLDDGGNEEEAERVVVKHDLAKWVELQTRWAHGGGDEPDVTDEESERAVAVAASLLLGDKLRDSALVIERAAAKGRVDSRLNTLAGKHLHHPSDEKTQAVEKEVLVGGWVVGWVGACVSAWCK
jgi:hypothetical protein